MVGTMPGAAEKMVCLGTVTAPHGVRGEVRIRTFTAQAEDLVAYGDLYDERGERRFEVRPVGSVRGAIIARILGIADRDAAERLRGLNLCVPRTALPDPELEEYYHVDLLGLRAELVSDGDSPEDGARAVPACAILGAVTAIDDFGAGPVLEIAVADGPPLLVPFTRTVVPWVDVDAGRIGIAAIPGLLGGAQAEEEPQARETRRPAPVVG